MKCPYCGFAQDRVVNSRESKEADSEAFLVDSSEIASGGE
jgi:hypothetical protein